MSLVSKLRAALAIPAVANGEANLRRLSPYDDVNHLWPIVAPDWFPTGGMTREQAMRIPAVNRARRTICNSIARMPLRAYRGDALLGKADRPNWLDRTDGPVSPYHRMLWTVDDLFFYGVSAWAVQRGAPAAPNTLGPVLSADRIPFAQWRIDGDTGQFVYTGRNGTEYPASLDEVIVIPGTDDGLLVDGLTSLVHARDLLNAATKAASTPSAYVHLHQTNEFPATEEQLLEARDAWIAARRGEGSGVAVTSAGIDVKELGTFNQHLLVEGRNAAALDVARSAGIPGSIIDAASAEGLTYVNAQAKQQDLIDFGLTAYMAPISARLGLDDMSPRGTRIAFDLEELLGPGAIAGTPDDGGASKRPAPTPTTNTEASQ
ncbi:phage portal protein [Tsukamurella paurometabola]|uniref:Phage portal protein, HK97 family n=1 Tax=Tsukamurella paurometabola TaxID=2061 RepID=A0A3P8L4A5_TSUPA|nr:phage portal protein [Tsukamurella paurometabola]UEA83107.1 phage portal protein [Tsukamurella paurometabola]VDR40195.1 phage portal protein, HK97 family [Tsukamurella paurometabola]